MVEPGEGSRRADGSSGDVPGRGAPNAGGAGPEPGITRLLAVLAELLERHEPEDLVVAAREELERREFTAYGQGWRDATDQYRADEVYGVVVPLPLGRVPGQAALIPFRRSPRGDRRRPIRGGGLPGRPAPLRDELPLTHAETLPVHGPEREGSQPGRSRSVPERRADPAPEQPASGHDEAPSHRGPAQECGGDVPVLEGEATGEAAEEASPNDSPGGPAESPPVPGAVPGVTSPAASSPAEARRGAGGTDAADAAAAGRPQQRGPAFVPKNRRSQVPSIPRLPPRRGGRRGEGSG
ncbi:hypothetical protein ACFV3R_06940 [Streptomyces sp. NPDC059740]|uniref:hypothetical protein n=1 Tax=Streptomyces sp. NPDC059740 TaxID=3346926 RepID=UPI00366273F7